MSSHFIGGVQAFSLRIMSIDSLPDACVSLVTGDFDIIFLSIAPRRATLPICSGASNPAGLIIPPFLARIELNTLLMCVSVTANDPKPTNPNVSSHARMLANTHVMTENQEFQTLSQSKLDRMWFPYKQHSASRSACRLSQRPRTHRLPLRD